MVVVVLTVCLYDVSVHATQLLAMISGGRSPGSQIPGDPATPSPPWWRGSPTTLLNDGQPPHAKNHGLADNEWNTACYANTARGASYPAKPAIPLL